MSPLEDLYKVIFALAKYAHIQPSETLDMDKDMREWLHGKLITVLNKELITIKKVYG